MVLGGAQEPSVRGVAWWGGAGRGGAGRGGAGRLSLHSKWSAACPMRKESQF